MFPNLSKTINPEFQEVQKFQAAQARKGEEAKTYDNQISKKQ